MGIRIEHNYAVTADVVEGWLKMNWICVAPVINGFVMQFNEYIALHAHDGSECKRGVEKRKQGTD